MSRYEELTELALDYSRQFNDHRNECQMFAHRRVEKVFGMPSWKRVVIHPDHPEDFQSFFEEAAADMDRGFRKPVSGPYPVLGFRPPE